LKTPLFVACVVVMAAVGCKSKDLTTAGGADARLASNAPTVLITNSTCAPGPCVPFHVRGFVPMFAVPGQPPAGFVDLGLASTAVTCLRLPAADTLTVIGRDAQNLPTDTTRLIWTIADPILLVAASSPMLGIGQTLEFVPAQAAGWAVTLPGTAATPATIQATACTP
jgi:hypothetical protein